MSDQIQRRGGTTAQHAAFTGALRELTVDTTKSTVVVHDGATPGGNALLRQDLSNLALSQAQANSARGVLGVMGRNLLINGGFTINQRVYVSAAALAATAYAHDRWKAGALGGDYSFTQLASNTMITLAAGKSLIQVVEDKNVQSSSYVLSWTGTATARVGVNTNIPSGAYASSPIVITGQAPGTTMSVEFGAGTLGNAQLESGTAATPFEFRQCGTELALCQRYFEQVDGTYYYLNFIDRTQFVTVHYKIEKRINSTLTLINSAPVNITNIYGPYNSSKYAFILGCSGTAMQAAGYLYIGWQASAEL